MPTIISPIITDAGLAAAINANANGLQIAITHVSLGTGQYTPSAGQTNMTNRKEKITISGGSISGTGGFNLNVLFPSWTGAPNPYNATELGFWAGDPDAGGVLFAVYSHTSSVIVQRNALDYVASFGMQLSRVPSGSVTVVVDPGGSQALALMAAHEESNNPHPAYAKFINFITGFDATGATNGSVVIAKGYAVAGDGGGGIFRYEAASVQPVDGGTVFAPLVGPGRLFREGWTVLGFKGEIELAWFGVAGDFVANDTSKIQAAINAHVALNAALHITAGTYKIVPATEVEDESNPGMTWSVKAGLIMSSKMNLRVDPGAVFKIANGVSTDQAPQSMRLFFSNEFLDGITIKGPLTLDMNGANNPISPNRAAFTFSRFTQAHFQFSGTPGGIAAGANNVTLEGVKFINGAGVSCINMAQSNSPGVTLGRNWTLFKCEFENNGLDTDDHSSIFGWADEATIMFCKFRNPAPYNNATKTGGLVAIETHGSDFKVFGCNIENYYQGLWIGTNNTSISKNINVFSNYAKVSQCFSDFYCANLSFGASGDMPIHKVSQYSNEIDITADEVEDKVKTFFRIAARKQPSFVDIHGNICRSFETNKSTTLVSIIVLPDQLAIANFINVHDNNTAGVVVGMVNYFGGANVPLTDGRPTYTDEVLDTTPGTPDQCDIGSVDFVNNKLGVLIPSPDSMYVNRDVILQGSKAGRVRSLRVGGLETLVSPVGTDSHAGGRATVYGKAMLDLPVTWNGINIGNGTTSKKIALDTDSGHALVSLSFAAGTTTTYSGNIYPSITGLTCDAMGAAAASHVKGGAGLALSSIIWPTSSDISLYAASGAPFDSSQTTTGSYITISGDFPCRSASI